MFAQTAEDPVEHLCGELHATKLDAEIIRAYFKIDKRIRKPFMRQLLEQVHAPAVSERTQADTSGQERPEPDISAKVAELERQNQELATEIAALKRKDALRKEAEKLSGLETFGSGAKMA